MSFWPQKNLNLGRVAMALIAVQLTAFQPAAAQAPSVFDRLLMNSEVRVLNEAECEGLDPATDPVTLRAHDMEPPNLGWAGWIPNASPEHPEPSDCRPRILDQALISSGTSTKASASAITGFFNRCGDRLAVDSPYGFMSLIHLSNTHYQICRNRDIRKVSLTLPNGDRVAGFLALKPGATARPLVIVKCGAFCNARGPALRFLIMHLFDESPFDVLALANTTGYEFVSENRYVSIGGLLEGQHLLYAAEIMKRGPLASLFSSVHAMGVSLGGHAALFASLMNDGRKFPGSTPPFTSTLAMCPVVDLRKSMDQVFQGTIAGIWARRSYDANVQLALQYVPELKPLFPDPTTASALIPSKMALAAVEHYRTIPAGWAPVPFEQITVASEQEFWKSNELLDRVAKQAIQTPTLAIASLDDQMVGTDVNSSRLQLALGVRAKADPANAATNGLATAIIAGGNHCAVNMVYGWRIFSTLMRSYVLSHSPEFLSRRQELVLPLPEIFARARTQLADNERFGRVRFSLRAGLPQLGVEINVHNTAGNCAGSNPSEAASNCFRAIAIAIPLSYWQNAPAWLRMPMSMTEAQTLTRWMNSNVVMVDSVKREIDGSRRVPVELSWYDYAD